MRPKNGDVKIGEPILSMFATGTPAATGAPPSAFLALKHIYY